MNNTGAHNTNNSRSFLACTVGPLPDGGLPEAGVEQGFGVCVHVGDPGEEDEGHLPHPQPVQLRRHQQVPDRRGVVPRKRPARPAEGAGGRLGKSRGPC